MTGKPSFSIVLACRNGRRNLARAINSVLVQDWLGCQLVVQDGASTDGSLEVLKGFGSRIDLESSPDAGIYDAWNRACQRVSGDWTLFLGADDFLVNGEVLSRAAGHLARLSPSIIFAYGVLAIARAGRVEGFVNRSRYEVIDIFRKGEMGLPFPATFVRSASLAGAPFNSALRIAGDLDFCGRRISGQNLARLPICISSFENGGISNSPLYASKLREERSTIYRDGIAPRRQELREAMLGLKDAQLMEQDFS